MGLEEDYGTTEKTCVNLDLGEPPEEVKAAALKDLGETDDVKACTVDELRDMIYEKGECTPHRMDDAYLVRFLRARYYNVEKAHQLMVNYYNFKNDNPGIQEGVEYLGEPLMYICDEDVISVLPYRDQLGRRIMIYRLGNWNPSIQGIDAVFQATLILLELAILEQRAQILGGVCFFDMENLSLQQAWQVTPSVATKIMQLMGGSFPIRIKAIHILNQPWVFDMVFAMFRPLLDERMRSKIHFHGTDYESLHTFVDPKHLPERYGGVRKEHKNRDWINSLDVQPKIVGELQTLGYICNLREPTPEEQQKNDLHETQESQVICQS